MLIEETDGRFYVAESTLPGAGNGLFAKQDLRRGSRFEVIGALVRRDSVADVCSHFADHHKFRVGTDLLLVPLGFGAMVNHSLTPNLEKVFEGDRVFLAALTDIAAGSELFFTYTEYAQQAFGLTAG